MWSAVSYKGVLAPPPLPYPPSPDVITGVAGLRTNPPPPLPTHPPRGLWTDFGNLAQSRGWPPFWRLWVWQLNLDSKSDHIWIFGAVIGHLEAEIEFLSFHRKWWKFARPPKFWTPPEILIGRAGTTSRYSMGEMPPRKAERSEPSGHLRSTCLRGNTSTRIWTRAFQPDQEEISSRRFCRAQIVSGRQTFLHKFWLGAEILPRRGDSSIVCLNFYQAPKFCIPT